MRAVATTTVTVLRGTSTDEFGDELDVDTAVYTGLPFSLIEQSRRIFDPATGTPRIVRTVYGRANAGTDLQTTDRLRDERSQAVYVINAVTQQTGVGGTPDLRVDLERVTT
jgi:hypothetical protein